jgi:two-component system, LuxR family, response regulator FixJ
MAQKASEIMLNPIVQPVVFHVDGDPVWHRKLGALARSVGLPVESYETAGQFLAAARSEQPGCLVAEARLPDQSGLELVRNCARQGLFLPPILLTAYSEVPLAVEAMKLGLVDFIEKPCGDQKLLDCVRRALALDYRRRQERARQQLTADRLALLKPPETEVLGLLLAGNGHKAIAAELKISVKTVESRRAKLMDKLECESLAELLGKVLNWQFWCATLAAWEVAEPPSQSDSSFRLGGLFRF